MKIKEIISNLNGLAKFNGVIESFQVELDDVIDLVFHNSPDLAERRAQIVESLVVLLEKKSGLSKVLVEAVLKNKDSVKG